MNKINGAIFYDADCAFCRATRKLVGTLLVRRGFRWLPMRTPGLAARLGVTEAALHAAMHLELADGRLVAGLEAWIVLLRSVHWMRPLARLLEVPGIHAGADAAYHWVARNRCCFGGKRAANGKGRPRRRTIPFLDLP